LEVSAGVIGGVGAISGCRERCVCRAGRWREGRVTLLRFCQRGNLSFGRDHSPCAHLVAHNTTMDQYLAAASDSSDQDASHA
jgi:hypothetical protein